ncbi:MAG TPA: OsmC family protein [Cellvibrio sp.]
MIQLEKASDGIYRQQLRIDGHEIFADVKAAVGGEDTAPDPHGLLDSSLAACTAITLTMFAKRRGIPVESINIDIERDDSNEKAGEYNLAMKIEFVGSLSEEQRQQLAGIVEKCPIHKLLSHGHFNITTTIA